MNRNEEIEILKKRMVEKDLQIEDLLGMLLDTHKENIQLKNKLNEKNGEEIPLAEFCCLEGVSPFSNNFMYQNGNKTRQYKGWQCNFPHSQCWKRTTWENLGVDFDKPLEIIIKAIAPKKLDIHNCQKSIIDQVFGDSRTLGLDDNLIQRATIERIGDCEDFNEGKIYYYIRNI